MLENKHSWWNKPNERHKPILMICYTNHALDQFLEYCINECDIKSGVIRIGGRSKSENLEPFLLKNVKQNLRSKRQIDKNVYYSIRDQNSLIYNIKTKISFITKKLDLIFNDHAILSIEELEKHISYVHFDQLKEYNRNVNRNLSLIKWLGLIQLNDEDLNEQFQDLELSDENGGEIVTGLNEDRDEDDESTIIGQNNPQTSSVDANLINSIENDFTTNERMLDDNIEEPISKKIEIFETNEIIKKEELYEIISKYKKSLGISENSWKMKKGNKSKNADQVKLEHVLEKIYSYAHKNYTDKDFELIENCPNIWQLDYNTRYLLFFHWINKYKDAIEEKLKILNNYYNKEVAMLQELRLQEDRSIMEDALIIAMTTTGSSRYHTVLKDIGPRIVIVEEAAEVFEAHIVSALSKHCEHLILIGDHVQLRPNPAVYTLATKYHLDVSLFERLIKNDTKRVMLNNQHRMRPEISILMKHFYGDNILNDDSVNSFPNVKGLKKNVYFIDHDKLEKRSEENTTKSNLFEADYSAKLSLYLSKQGYDQSEITVLTMYLGQYSEIKKRLRNLELNSIKVSTVDNYQGEENKIIILSLVRSNLEKKIGFLSIENRVCVALSRAKHGLYVIGNFKFIAESEKKSIWKNLIDTIKLNKNIGRSLSLTCGAHPENDVEVNEISDFDKRPDGGCLLPCNFRLKCGHVCPRKCHANYDNDHSKYECQKKCGKKMESCGHLCEQKCGTKHKCNKCHVKVYKEIEECGHMVKIRCDTIPTRNYCENDCEKILKCGHKCTKKCSLIDCGECLTKINVISPCVHESVLIVNCSDSKWTYKTKCTIPCCEILDCGHLCSGRCGTCFGGLLHQSCKQKCDSMLFCGHKCIVPCAKQCEPCKKKCEIKCYHSKCNNFCSEPCTDCIESCNNSCKHSKCTNLCHELCDRDPCNEPCDKILKCGHMCIGICGEICPLWCRICDKDVVSSIFFGNEDDPDAKFIYLKECKHLIEVSGMDYWIESRYVDNNNNSTNSIQLPDCPKCKTPIRNCKRYANVIKTQLKALNQIKLKHFGNIETNRILYQELNKQINENLNLKFFKSKHYFIIENLKNVLKEDMSFNSLAAIKNTLNVYLKIEKIRKSIDHKNFNFSFDQKQHFKFEIKKILDSLYYQRELVVLKNGQKLMDISLELERIASIVEFERMKNLSFDKTDLPANARVILSRLENFLIEKVVKFDKIQNTVQNLFIELASLIKTELTKEEKLMIVNAIGLSSGHWFKCPNGHVYCIGECGGAMQKSRCPDCRAEIGGLNHQITSGNQLASEMDGATRPAWPTALNF